MIRYFYNNSFILDIKNYIKKAKITKNKKIKCSLCGKIIENNNYVINDIIFTSLDVHNLEMHYFTSLKLYDDINHLNEKIKLNINDINVMDGLFEVGSKKIYIEAKKNETFDILKFSEHYGYLELKLNKINKICVLNKKRNDDNFKDIYMPQVDIELFEHEYIFHTHPKFDKLGYRRLIIFEYPSINDLLHFIDHYNLGLLKGSIIISPEGMYIIKKYDSHNNNKIIVDTDIFVNKINETYVECEEILINKYYLNNITYDYFYEKVIKDLECIIKINDVLKMFDMTVDYYARSQLSNNYVILSVFV